MVLIPLFILITPVTKLPIAHQRCSLEVDEAQQDEREAFDGYQDWKGFFGHTQPEETQPATLFVNSHSYIMPSFLTFLGLRAPISCPSLCWSLNTCQDQILNELPSG